MNLPYFIWMAPPTHCNFGHKNNDFRLFQTKCLTEIVSTKRNMLVLKLVKIWEHEDCGAFLHEAYRFTSDGLDKYWASVDSAIRYWDVILSPKILDRKKNGQKNTFRPRYQGDKFHWRRNRRFDS